MAQRILLGPCDQQTLRDACAMLANPGPVVTITAGWQDEEGDIGELADELQLPLEDLGIYARAEEWLAREPGLRDLNRERQEQLLKLQELYRIRLGPTLRAARGLQEAEAPPELLRPELKAAIAQLRALDRHHLRRLRAIHQVFERRLARLQGPQTTREREAVQSRLQQAGLVLVAGGHVAVLINRIRQFSLGSLLATKPLVAWSAGAMVLSERIVVFHQRAPQGLRDAEVLDEGLGIVPGLVLLPHARTRLDWGNPARLALFSQRFAPSACCTLDESSLIRLDDDRIADTHDAWVLGQDGGRRELQAR